MWQVEWTFINQLRTRNKGKGQSGSHAGLLTLRSHAAPDEVLTQPADSAEVLQKTFWSASCCRPRRRVELISEKPLKQNPHRALHMKEGAAQSVLNRDDGIERNWRRPRSASCCAAFALCKSEPVAVWTSSPCNHSQMQQPELLPCSPCSPSGRLLCPFCCFNETNQHFLKAATLCERKLPFESVLMRFSFL